MTQALRIVVVAPDLSVVDQEDAYAVNQAERSRSLRIGLLENGFNLMAVLPVYTFLPEVVGSHPARPAGFGYFNLRRHGDDHSAGYLE